MCTRGGGVLCRSKEFIQASSLVHSRVLSSNSHLMPGAWCLRNWTTETTGSVQRRALLRPLVAGRALCRRQEGAAPPLTTGGQPHPAGRTAGCDSAEKPKDGPTSRLLHDWNWGWRCRWSNRGTAKGKATGHGAGTPPRPITWLPVPIARNMPDTQLGLGPDSWWVPRPSPS